MLEWKNEVGVRWNLISDLEKGVLNTDQTNPYFNKGAAESRFEKEGGEFIGFLSQSQWSVGGEYLPPPSRGKLVELDPALRVEPPKGLELGYVPIVLGQRAKR